MNLRQLRSLIAIAERGSFTAAAEAMGLSHSAVSLQMKALESELGVELIDRRHRPPRLTARGVAMVEQARRMAAILEEIRGLGAEAALTGSLAVGVVPTEMVHLLPPALKRLRSRHPRLAIHVRTGLSSELAEAVRRGELDAAVATMPRRSPRDLAVTEVAREPLMVIAPEDVPGRTPEEVIDGNPFIWFSRRTWAGQQIEQVLAARGLAPAAAMEVDSLEAIESLVAHGLGVSVVPARPGVPFDTAFRRVPLEGADAVRRLGFLMRPDNPKHRLAELLEKELVAAVNGA